MFHPGPLPSTSAFNEPYVKSQLQKWDLQRGSRCVAVRYTKFYHKMQAADFVLDLLNDPKVREVLQVLKGGQWVSLQGPVEKVDVEVVPAALTRLDVFDKLSEGASPPIVRPNGDLSKCMEDAREGFQVSDLLRDLILNEDSENAGLYSEDERSELLWRLLEHMSLGGPCCQFEDKLEPYVETAKRVYKELVSAQKNPASGKIEVASVVYKLKGITSSGPGPCLFPAPSRQNWCYVSVDPARRLAKIWYHAWQPYW